MVVSFTPGQIIAFMDGYNPLDWRENRIPMEELTHNRVLGYNKVISVFFDHISDSFGHLSRAMDSKEIVGDR